MKLNPNSKNSVATFKHIHHLEISKNSDDGFLDLFLLPINARNFDYNLVSESLMESILDYAVSWKTKEKYKNNTMKSSQIAREKFKDYEKNDGELGEFLLFCFLEGHLEAPKILTKLELKTSNQLYVNGADGVHLKKISDKKYHLIFGESKMYENFSTALKKAFESIKGFKYELNEKDKFKSGILFEKGLISSNIEKYVFEDNEEDILNMLIYPGERNNTDISLDDAFSIFIGYEIDIFEEIERCSSDEFPIEIEKKVINKIEKYRNNIYKFIKEYDLLGHTFYIFIMPFTDIDKNRKYILERIIK